jgi:hypothetical protein
MKNSIHTKITLILFTLAHFANVSFADGKHQDHHTEKEAGPNGGRIIKLLDTELEFFVREDGKVQITYLNEGNVVAVPKDQKVSLVGGSRSAPTKFTFRTENAMLVSNEPIPDIKNMPVILSIMPSASETTARERFNLNFNTCPDCGYKEYACICDHAEGHHDDE